MNVTYGYVLLLTSLPACLTNLQQILHLILVKRGSMIHKISLSFYSLGKLCLTFEAARAAPEARCIVVNDLQHGAEVVVI